MKRLVASHTIVDQGWHRGLFDTTGKSYTFKSLVVKESMDIETVECKYPQRNVT